MKKFNLKIPKVLYLQNKKCIKDNLNFKSDY